MTAADSPRQMHLAAHFPGVNNTTVWSDPDSGSQIDPSSFEHLARVAERGRFDFFFLAEGLRVREHRGLIHDLDVVGRPDAVTVLAHLAAVTTHLGLGATVSATFNEPYELGRKLASLDLVSGGRVGWNVVTSSDAFHGANFRRGGFLRYRDRYERAREFLAVCRQLWDSWPPDALGAAPGGEPVGADGIRPFAHAGDHFDVRGRFPVPRSPQGRPVIIQAGDSDGGRDFGAEVADVIFTRHGTYEGGQRFYADVKAKAESHGRRPDDLKVMPGVTFALGDTDEEAQEVAYQTRRRQVSPQTAIVLLEQVWGRDLSAYDADGPLPDIDPDVEGFESISKGRVKVHKDPLAVAEKWRSIAEAKGGLSIRELMIELGARQSFVGSPATVADQLDRHVQGRACDGFIVIPSLVPRGLDRFVDEVVPLLQERGVFRSEYTGSTLRDHLGLDLPTRSTPVAATAAARPDDTPEALASTSVSVSGDG